MDPSTLPDGARPMLRRVDARTGQVHDYATEIRVGAGRVIVSTLGFDGSSGDQPLGLCRNTGGAYLLTRWLRALASPAVRLRGRKGRPTGPAPRRPAG